MSEVIWKNGAAFWLLWILPALAVLAVYAHRRVRHAARQFAGDVMTPRLLPPLDGRGPLRKAVLLLGGFALAIVAAAQPSWGVYYVPTAARGLDLVVALDVSRSMLADDGGDTRLARARSAVSWLVHELPGDRVGLLLFAGTTAQACPLTLDRGFFESALRDANADSVGRGGTKIGPALDEALRMLDTSWDRDKLVLLVTDGGDQESFPKTAAERLRDKKIRVIALGLGRAEAGAPLVLDGQIVRQKDGQPVMARLNDALLTELAVTTGGMFVPPEKAHELPELYRTNFSDLRRGANQELQEKHHRDQFQWFLAGALVLLLLQAGRSAYPRRRSVPASVVATLCAVGLLLATAGCGGDRGRVQVAVDQLARGEAEAAEQAFVELSAELPDEPVIAFDLGCAHQARGRLREARARYVDVLVKGDRKLRARAHANLAMLDVERMRERIGADAATLTGDTRDEVRELAEGALDALQRARELDPDLAEVVRRQDVLARWLRVTENAWREHDRAAERAQRAAAKGAAFLGAWIEAERQLVGRLAGGELLEDVELRQRDLAEELPDVKDRFVDEGAELPEALQGDVAAVVDEVAAELTAIGGLLRDGRARDATAAIEHAADRLTAAWALWTDPGSSLAAAARGQASFVQALARETFAPAAGEESDPQARLAVAARARDALQRREEQIAEWIANVGRRLDPAHASEEWPAVFVERARARLPDVEEQARLAAARVRSTGPQALVAGTRAQRQLEGLALEWQLAGLEPAELARRLEDEQVRLVRAADGMRGTDGDAPGILERLGQLAQGLARTLAQAPLRTDQDDQVERTRYLAAAIDRALAADAPEDPDADPQQQAAAAEQLAARREVALQQVDSVRAAMARAAASIGAAADDTAVAAMHDARVAVRAVWTGFAGFEAALRRAAEDQTALADGGEAAAATAAEDQTDAIAFARALRDAAREQGVTADLVAMLQQGLAAERTALEAQADAAPDPDQPAVEREERDARLEALRGLGALLDPAADASRQAAAALVAPATDDFESLRAAFQQAAPQQRRAADLLKQALDQLEQARLPLKELARRLLEGETDLLRAARELAAGRPLVGPDGNEITWELLQQAEQEAGAYVSRLEPALERELAQVREAQAAADPQASQPTTGSEAEDALRAMVGGIEAGHGALRTAFDSGDDTAKVRAIEDALGASRALWGALGEFQEVLERAVAEQAELVARTEQLAKTTDVPRDRREDAASDQARTARWIPPLRAHVDAAKQQAQTAAAQQGQPAAPAPGGLSPEVIELAERNLPAAETAMSAAGDHLRAPSYNDALDRLEEAHRLLEEILEKLQQEQDQQQDQQQQEQEQQQQQQQQLSADELERLVQAVKERNERQRQTAKRTPAEEDW